MCSGGDDASYVCFGKPEDKYLNRSLRHGTKMRHRNLHSNSVLVHTGYLGTGAKLAVPFLGIGKLGSCLGRHQLKGAPMSTHTATTF